MTKNKTKQILITDFDGYNVHNPDRSHEFREFPTLHSAEAFAEIVKQHGWTKATELLATFKEIVR